MHKEVSELKDENGKLSKVASQAEYFANVLKVSEFNLNGKPKGKLCALHPLYDIYAGKYFRNNLRFAYILCRKCLYSIKRSYPKHLFVRLISFSLVF